MQRLIVRHYAETQSLQNTALNRCLIKSLTLELRELCRRGGERVQESEEMENIRRAWSSESSKQGSYELMETKAPNTGLTWVCTRGLYLKGHPVYKKGL